MSFLGHLRTDGKVLVDLLDLELAYAAFIVEKPGTGVVYTNQVGGNACAHPEVEGYCVPSLPSIVEAPEWMRNWYGEVGEGSGITYKRVQDWLDRDVFFVPTVSLDKERWTQSGEAWIWVKVRPQLTSSTDFSLGELRAVLTWPNTD